MQLKQITFTGADNTTPVEALVEISQAYPRVEWGILFSASQQGSGRFPPPAWIDDFAIAAKEHGLNACAHLCGKWVRYLVEKGEESWFAGRGDLLPIFQRIHINFHAESMTPCDGFYKMLERFGDKQFIFQLDDVNNSVLEECISRGINAVGLFDVSGGAGIVPDAWPAAIKGRYNGYAGGLGPDNIAEQLPKIAKAAGKADVWIDMEANVRADNDTRFDLDKVRAVLVAAEAF